MNLEEKLQTMRDYLALVELRPQVQACIDWLEMQEKIVPLSNLMGAPQ
jgi:hypothetical protein